MSIEMENPKTIVELIDAAANLVEQMNMAKMIHDEERFKYAHKNAGDFLHKALVLCEEKGIE